MGEKNVNKSVGAKDDILLMEPKYFGPFWEYVKDDNITDVDFNGTDLWITDAKNRRTKIENHGVTADFVHAFSQRVANQVSKPFNKMNNLLEAETKTLRISILHESAAVSGRSICLRKTLPTVRITPISIINDAYMPRPIMNLLANCIAAKMNFVIGGEPGAGKDLADDTPVPVPVSKDYPMGWAKHGDLKAGDRVYTPDGSIVAIDYVTPGRDLDLYEIEFSDGQIIKASDTHLWRVSTFDDRQKQQSMQNVLHYMDAFFFQELSRIRSLAKSLSNSFLMADAKTLAETANANEDELVAYLKEISLPCVPIPNSGEPSWPVDEALYAWADHMAESYDSVCNTSMSHTKTLSTKELAKQVVLDDGRLNYAVAVPCPFDCPDLALPVDPYLLGSCHCSASRRLPAIYLRASMAQRLSLLQGIMDAIGSIDHTGTCRLFVKQAKLAEDVLELIRSLGIKAKLTDGSNGSLLSFRTILPVFLSNTENAAKLPKTMNESDCWNYIVAIRHVASEHGKCIHVDHPGHLYLAGGFIPTHNTECAKFFTQFVKKDQRVITIEDSPEWHFHEINPYHDCVEMRVNPDFDYAKAIKTCLRQNPKWIMLSEARSVEVKYLIESWSTGVNGVTTIHTDDIRKIPSRLLNMMANRDDADRLENDIYDFVNVAMLVRRKAQMDGSAHRYIDQMGFLYRDGNQNKIHMLVKNGELVSDHLPPDIAFRLEQAEIQKPFECEQLDQSIGDRFQYVYMKKEEPAAVVPETAAPVTPVSQPIPPAAEAAPAPSVVKPPIKPAAIPLAKGKPGTAMKSSPALPKPVLPKKKGVKIHESKRNAAKA